MKNVIKRNGTNVPFDACKIENALAKAFLATGEIEVHDISTMSRAIELMVESSLNASDLKIPTVEEIHFSVDGSFLKVCYDIC